MIPVRAVDPSWLSQTGVYASPSNHLHWRHCTHIFRHMHVRLRRVYDSLWYTYLVLIHCLIAIEWPVTRDFRENHFLRGNGAGYFIGRQQS